MIYCFNSLIELETYRHHCLHSSLYSPVGFNQIKHRTSVIFMIPSTNPLTNRFSLTSEMPSNFVSHMLEELGCIALYNSALDTKILCVQRFIRLFAYGGSSLILASYLSALEISRSQIGLFMTLTLAEDVVISLFLTLIVDPLGRKTILALGALLLTMSGIVFALSGNYWVLLVAAIFGIISPRYVKSFRFAFVTDLFVLAEMK